MNPLLEWSLSQTNSQQLQSSQIDPARSARLLHENAELVEELMKSGLTKMKEYLAIAVDLSKSDEEREQALDDLENLVEDLDNANDFHKTGGIEAMLAIIQDSTSHSNLKLLALWVLGTCSQNNTQFTERLLERKGLPALLSFIDGTNQVDSKLQNKALYCISGCTMSSIDALKQLETCNGFAILMDFFLNPQSLEVSRKVAFLFLTLIHQYGPNSEVMNAVKSAGLLRKLLIVLTIYDDHEIREKVFETFEAASAVETLREQMNKDLMVTSLNNWISAHAPSDQKQDFLAILNRIKN